MAGNGRQPRRFVALAADAGIGLVRCVGFQQQLFQRHLTYQPLQSLRAVVGQWAAEAEQEALPVQLRGLFGAAGKAVHHAAQAADAADGGDHRIHRTSRVHDHRQLEFTGQFQLADEIHLLSLGIQSFDEEVQAAFADRAGAFALDPLAQQRQVPRLVLGQEHRMQAVGRVQTRCLPADLAQLRPAACGHRRYHLQAHTSRLRTLDHGGAVTVELAGVQMAVAVDQHAQRCSSGGGVMALRLFQLASSRVPKPSTSSSTNGIGSGMNNVSTNRPAVSLNRVG